MRVRMTVFGVLLAAVALSAQQNPYVGRWNITGTGPDTDKIYFLEVKQNGAELSGLFLDRSAHATPVSWIRVENGELAWQYGGGGETLPKPACGPVYRARLEGGKLVGHHTTPGDPCPQRGARAAGAGGTAAPGATGAPAPTPAPAPAPAPARAASSPPAPREIKWVGVRQPVWPPSNANGTHTYGKPVVLVGSGVGKEVWTGTTPACEDRWSIVDGVWLNEVPKPGERPTCNPRSVAKFKDFKVTAEFKLDEGQNSGFYIRGRYELQLALGENASPATAGRQALMAIYGWKAADVYAGKPAGEWQVLEAIVVGNHITATLNGKRVHDNAVLPAFTGGALDNDELAPGPIMIQGDHSRIAFRSLVVTPMTKAGS
ncbi:MAG: DUF1080 domain-containing protein [Acidobacteriota bacterium]